MENIRKTYLNSIKVGWFLAVRQIKRLGKGTTALIIFIMVLTFLNLVVVSGLLVGLITGSFKQFQESYSGEVIVTSATGRDYIENSQGLISFLRNNPSVEHLSARHTIGAKVLGTLNDNPKKLERTNSVGASIVGIDPAAEESVTNFSRSVMRGEKLVAGKEGYILIGKNLLRKYSSFADADVPGLELLNNVDVGTRVRMTITTKDGQAITKDLIVGGVLTSKVDQISTRMYMLDTELKRMLPVNNEQVQEIALRTDPANAQALVSQIKAFMGSSVARVQTSAEAIPSFLRDIETTMTVLGNALSSIALVVAVITIFIVIFINAVTKRKFIGIMKGIGISPLAIEASYVFQALFYGITGSIIGLLLTFGVIKPYFTANPINFAFSDGILVATPEGAAIRVLILLIVTLAAGYLPAKIIVRKNTLDSILGR